MASNDILLEVQGLTVDYRSAGGVVGAVRGVSYQLHRGETLGIVGETGAGKSAGALALLRLLPEPPAVIAGEARLDGVDLLALGTTALREVRGRKVGVVFQDPMTCLNPVVPVGVQVMESLIDHRLANRTQARSRMLDLLDDVGIKDAGRRAKQYPHEFSGGMRQRVMIAAALACDPQLVIADEPTTGLDVAVQAEILDLVRRLRDERGMAVLWVSHDLGVVAGLADRVLVFYAGRVVEDAPVDDLYAKPRHPYTRSLLACVPTRSTPPRSPLPTVRSDEGIVGRSEGCAFAPRCELAEARCWATSPPLVDTGGGHAAACWVTGGALQPSRTGD